MMKSPIIIAHRGASAFRPEHTLKAYELAIDLGADFVEPDLVPTKDGVLVARHENELSSTTNIIEYPEFANRQTTKIIDRNSVTGWFAEDFTLVELKTLRAKERIPDIRPHNTNFDNLYEIPTLVEIIDFVKQKSKAINRNIGIYPETKHPTFFAKEGKFIDGELINISLGQLLIDTLVTENFTDPNRIFIQSFEFENLIELSHQIMTKAGIQIPLVQLYGSTNLPTNNAFSRPYDIFFNAQQGADMASIYGDICHTVKGIGLNINTGYGHLDNQETLQCIRDSYAQGVGPFKHNLLPRTLIASVDKKTPMISQLTGEVTSFVEDAHNAGLVVHPYTLRPETPFLTLNPDGTLQTLTDEVIHLVNIGVDGFFCDDPRTCRQAIDTLSILSNQALL